MSNNKLAIIIGSGVSIPAGIKSVKTITDIVLGKDAFPGYLIPQNVCSGNKTVKLFEQHKKISDFLRMLKREIECDKVFGREVQLNYEDIYYILTQIHDNLSGAYHNPAILPLIRNLISGLETNVEKLRLHRMVDDAKNYIRAVLCSILKLKLNSLDYLSIFKEICIDKAVRQIDIFTLNHDLVLESYFSQENIAYIDGFNAQQEGICYWKPELFDRKDIKVLLFKLHGSLNWFWYSHPDHNQALLLGKEDIFCRKNSYEELGISKVGGPEFLVGTFNKMFEYINRIYFELHYQFFRRLQHTNRLLIMGYGFGDKGINARIIDWIYASAKNKLLVIHPEPEKLKNSTVGAIRKEWGRLKKEDRLFTLAGGIETACWDEARELLF